MSQSNCGVTHSTSSFTAGLTHPTIGPGFETTAYPAPDVRVRLSFSPLFGAGHKDSHSTHKSLSAAGLVIGLSVIIGPQSPTTLACVNSLV